jgi:Uma2 family endonuclease
MIATATMSIERFRQLPDFESDGTSYELDEGELIRVSPGGTKHSVVVQRISYYLELLADPKAFTVVSGDAGFELGANTVRGADIAVLAEVLDVDSLTDGYFTSPPAIVIEVVGAKHDAEQLERKITQYLGAGVKEVLAVYVRSKRTYVYGSDRVTIVEPNQQYFSNALGLLIVSRFFFERYREY